MCGEGVGTSKLLWRARDQAGLENRGKVLGCLGSGEGLNGADESEFTTHQPSLL